MTGEVRLRRKEALVDMALAEKKSLRYTGRILIKNAGENDENFCAWVRRTSSTKH